MKKKLLTAFVLVLCAVVLVVGSVLTTMALLTSSAVVSNVFTVGDVKITMYESKVNTNGTLVEPVVKVDTNTYHLLPGETYIKDPTIYIDSAEENMMYLFVKSNNMIRSAEAANYPDPPAGTPKSMREQMHANGWVEYIRSGDGVEIIWVYGTRDVESGEITPTPVNCKSEQTRANGEKGNPGEFRLCESFTIHQDTTVALYGAASVTFTGFAIQHSGFSGDGSNDHALTQAAWEAVKGSFPYACGIVNPVNPYNNSSTNPYDAVPGVENPLPVGGTTQQPTEPTP